jgi:hypothetical protein
VDEPRPGHRLDHRPHPLAAQAIGELTQAVSVRRRGRVLDQLTGIVDETDIETTAT